MLPLVRMPRCGPGRPGRELKPNVQSWRRLLRGCEVERVCRSVSLQGVTRAARPWTAALVRRGGTRSGSGGAVRAAALTAGVGERC